MTTFVEIGEIWKCGRGMQDKDPRPLWAKLLSAHRFLWPTTNWSGPMFLGVLQLFQGVNCGPRPRMSRSVLK